jgi:hypothetical protein
MLPSWFSGPCHVARKCRAGPWYLNRRVREIPTRCRERFVNQKSQEPAAKSAVALEATRITGCFEAAALHCVCSRSGICQYPARNKVKRVMASGKPLVKRIPFPSIGENHLFTSFQECRAPSCSFVNALHAEILMGLTDRHGIVIHWLLRNHQRRKTYPLVAGVNSARCDALEVKPLLTYAAASLD